MSRGRNIAAAWLVLAAGCVRGGDRAHEAKAPVTDVGQVTDAGTVEASGEAPAGSVEASGEAPAGSVEASGELPAGSVEASGEGPAGTVEASGEVLAGGVDTPPGADPRPRGGVPQVRVSPVTVGPKVPPELVTRVIRKHRPALDRCHAQHPGAPAVDLSFTVGAGGVVDRAEALEAGGVVSTHPANVCVVTELRTLRFPNDLVGMIIRYPLR